MFSSTIIFVMMKCLINLQNGLWKNSPKRNCISVTGIAAKTCTGNLYCDSQTSANLVHVVAGCTLEFAFSLRPVKNTNSLLLTDTSEKKNSQQTVEVFDFAEFGASQ